MSIKSQSTSLLTSSAHWIIIAGTEPASCTPKMSSLSCRRMSAHSGLWPYRAHAHAHKADARTHIDRQRSAATGQYPCAAFAGSARGPRQRQAYRHHFLRHGHFTARNVGAQALAQAAEGQVTDRREWRQVQLVAEVDLAPGSAIEGPRGCTSILGELARRGRWSDGVSRRVPAHGARRTSFRVLSGSSALMLPTPARVGSAAASAAVSLDVGTACDGLDVCELPKRLTGTSSSAHTTSARGNRYL